MIQLQGFRFLRSWSVEAYAIKGRKEYAAHRIAQQTRDAYEEEGSTVANSQELNDRHETEREERGVEDRYSEQWESIPTNGREDGWCVGERRDELVSVSCQRRSRRAHVQVFAMNALYDGGFVLNP